MALRDIREDLRERLALAKKRANEIDSKFEADLEAVKVRYKIERVEAEAEFRSLRTLLFAEERRHGASVQQPTAELPPLPLADFLEDLIRIKSPRTKNEFREEAITAGYFPDGENTGRMIHMTLLNITRSGRIRDMGDGTYGLPEL